MLSRDARWIAAAVQIIIAWEWFVSGVNKVLSGTFPADLHGILEDGVSQNPNGWYVALLQGVVLPHSVAFGFLIEIAEVGVGIALFIGALVLIGPVRRAGMPEYRLAVGEIAMATVAAFVCAFLCVNFHFFMGDGLIPWFHPANAADEGITLDTLMPPLALLILLVNAYVLVDMTNWPIAHIARNLVRRVRGVRIESTDENALPQA